MKAIPLLCSLGFLMINLNAFAQHHVHQDTLKNQEIEEVVVTSQVGITKQLEKEHRASKQANIDQILDRIAGVQMIRRGSYAWEPTIRSLNAAQISLSIDGMAVFGACTDRMDPVSSYVEPSNLQQINVNLGPSFNNYAGGLAGGVDFKLATPELSEMPKLKGMVGTGFETNSQAVQTLATMNYSSGKFGILLNGIFRKAQNYRSANEQIVPNSQFQKWNGSIAVKYKLNEKNQIIAQYLADYGQNIGYPALTMDVAFANANIGSITHTYTSNISGLSDIKSKIYFNHIDHAMDDTKRPIETVPMHMDMPGLSWTAGFYSETGYSLKNHFIQARINGYLNRLTANMTMYPSQGNSMFMFTLPDAQRNMISLDVSDKIYLTQQWVLEFLGTYSNINSSIYSQEGKNQLSSMNSEDLSRSNHIANINFTGHYHYDANLHFMAKVGYANRAASLQEYYGFYLFNRLDNYDYLGNINLKTEKSMQASLGVSYQLPWLRVEATAYNYYFNDYIAGVINKDFQVMTIGATGVKQSNNLPNANVLGAELALRLKILKNLDWYSTMTYSEGKDYQGNYLPLISPFTNTNSIILNVKGWTGQFDIAYYGKQNKVSPEFYGETSTPEVTLLHAGLRKTFSLKQNKITANLRVENILDKYYYRHQDIMKIARPGRNFIAQVNLSF